MAKPIIIEADIPDALQDDFREALLKVPEQKNIGALVAFMFMAGANAQRTAGVALGARSLTDDRIMELADQFKDDLIGFANAILTERTVGVAVPARPELPALLFDGYYVYAEGLTDDARKRTSPQNVSDVLDAVVRLLRADGVPEGAK